MATSLLGLLRRQLFSKTYHIDQLRALIREGKLSDARSRSKLLSPDTLNRESELLALEGEILFHERRDNEAEAHFRDALRRTPGLGSAHFGLSAILAEQGQIELAIIHAQFAWGTEKSSRAAAQVGYCQLIAGNLPAAEGPLRRAVRLDPANATAWNNLGIVLAAKQQLSEARMCFSRALSLKPDLASAAEHLAQAEANAAQGHEPVGGGVWLERMRALGRAIQDGELQRCLDHMAWADAVERGEDLMASAPDNEETAILLLHLHEANGDLQSGLDSLTAWIEVHPDSHQAARELGLALVRADEAKAAMEWLPRAREAAPLDLEVLKGIAKALAELQRYEEALEVLQAGIDLAPEDIELQGMHAGTLCNACRYEEALTLCESLRDRGFTSPSHGLCLAYLGRFDEAIQLIEEGLSRQPRDPNYRMYRGQIRLGNEDFEQGWEDYAFRTNAGHTVIRALPFPLWRGEPLHGKKIIVLAEQGIGDQVMFASCIPDLLKLNPASVVIEALDRVAPTLSRSFPTCEVVPTRQNLHIDWVRRHADADFFVPMGDLPRFFRASRDNFPQHEGYLLADADDTSYWRRAIDKWEEVRGVRPGSVPRIGFSWKGGTAGTRANVRTLDPFFVAPLTNQIEASWICLQYGNVDQAIDQLNEAGLQIGYWPQSIADLDQFTALILGLDLVITVCNSTVHYAGATGTPTWILTPRIPEWRYGVNSSTMPWYPSTKILRQDEAGSWESVVSKAEAMLREGVTRRAR